MNTQPVFTAEAVEALRKTGHVQDVRFATLPAEAIPPGLQVAKPHVAVIQRGDGGVEVTSIKRFVDEYRGKPERRKGLALAETLDSFLALVERHGTTDTAIFVNANWREPHLTAVIDYHQPRMAMGKDPESLDAGDDEGARFCEHRIEYPFPLSESWKRWVEQDGKLMTQADFAAFLEDHIHELSSPIAQEEAEAKSRFKTSVGAPATILDLSRELEVTVGARVKSKKRLDNGDQALVFESDTTATTSGGQAVDVPGMFIVNVPVFHAGDQVRVLARLRYRPAGENGVLWAYQLHRPDEIVNDAIVNAVAHGESRLGLPFYYGAPEK